MGYYSGTIQHGSSGEDVKKWQEFLNTQGHSLAVDGIFGDATLDATRTWQGNNGLGVDGIVGENTWGKAGFKNVNTPVVPNIEDAPTAEELTYNPFNSTTEGEKLYGEMNTASENLKNYGDFSYDFNADALYNQYKDKYIQQGKMAMADAIGQASAMTGGYGNSYAATVGNQQYQAQLNNLNDIIPNLYQMAYDRWNDKYSRTKDAYNAAYGAYYDAADLYTTEQDALNSLAQKNFENAFSLWEANTENAWKQADWDESMRRYALEQLQDQTGGVLAGGVIGGTKKKNLNRYGAIAPTAEQAGAKTANSSSFISKHETLSEWTRHGKSTSSYYDYIKDEIKKIEDSLTDSELLYLIEHYNIPKG